MTIVRVLLLDYDISFQRKYGHNFYSNYILTIGYIMSKCVFQKYSNETFYTSKCIVKIAYVLVTLETLYAQESGCDYIQFFFFFNIFSLHYKSLTVTHVTTFSQANTINTVTNIYTALDSSTQANRNYYCNNKVYRKLE